MFKSSDRGAQWSPVNVGLPMPGSAYGNGGPYINSLAIDPQNTATVYAGVSFFGDVLFAEPLGRGVYRSDDGGNTWHAANIGIEGCIVYALAIDSGTPTTLFAACKIDPARHGPAQVFRSTDGGASWSVSLPLVFDYVFDLAIDPHAPATVYAAATSGLFKTTDGGNTWTAMSSGLTTTNVSSLAINRTDSSIVYAGTRGGGVFKSTNAGSSWTPVNTGLTGSFVRTLKIDLGSPSTLYAGLEDGAIFKTTNEGATWTPINSGLPPPRIGQSGPGWGINSLAVDPQTPSIVYAATDPNGVFKTVNGGDQWSRTTLSSIRVFSIALDSIASIVSVGEDRGRVYMRSDEGDWTVGSLTPSQQGPGRGSVVALDPLVPTTAYAATGGLIKTTDGGATWSSVLAGPVFSVALDPVSPSTVYAGGNGAQKSVDGGATWTQLGLSGGPLQLLVVDPQTTMTLYAGFGGFRNEFGNGLYKSVNGGSEWARLEGLPSVGALAIDPQVTSTIYAGDRGTQVFKSTNGGESWSLASTGLPTREVVALAVNPDTPAIVFAGLYGGGVFKSSDGGAHWTAMNDQLPNLLVRALAFDPKTSTLYVGTDGGGVFTTSSPARFSLTIETSGRGDVTVVSSAGGIECGPDCSEQYDAGTTVILTARAEAGNVKGWTGCDSDTGKGRTSSCTVTLDAARTVAVQSAGRPDVANRH